MSRVVAVCGGRNYGDRIHVYRALDVMHEALTFSRLIHGCAPGADTLAARWAFERGVPCIGVPAVWETHGRAAGPIRNQYILDAHEPQTLFAFPGGTGTADMMQRARVAGVTVIRCTPPALFEAWP